MRNVINKLTWNEGHRGSETYVYSHHLERFAALLKVVELLLDWVELERAHQRRIDNYYDEEFA